MVNINNNYVDTSKKGSVEGKHGQKKVCLGQELC